MFPNPAAFVDLETTGMTASDDRDIGRIIKAALCRHSEIVPPRERAANPYLHTGGAP